MIHHPQDRIWLHHSHQLRSQSQQHHRLLEVNCSWSHHHLPHRWILHRLSCRNRPLPKWCNCEIDFLWCYSFMKSTSLSRSPAIFAPALLLWALPAAIFKAPMCLKRSKICFFGATKDTVLSKVLTSHCKCLAIDSDSAKWVPLHHVQVNLVPHQVPNVVNPISGGRCGKSWIT